MKELFCLLSTERVYSPLYYDVYDPLDFELLDLFFLRLGLTTDFSNVVLSRAALSVKVV